MTGGCDAPGLLFSALFWFSYVKTKMVFDCRLYLFLLDTDIPLCDRRAAVL